MNGTVRISGRWVPVEVLARISKRSEGPEVPSRTELVDQFCRAVHWYNGQGEPCRSSARSALKRLEERGLVQLPPPVHGPKRSARQLLDDGNPLPPVPRLPTQGWAIAGLRLRLIEGEKDPNHRIWNRLITREHPLKGAPLVGTQLRYLIECEAGIVGAFGFGPPAYHLSCRDQWVGWSQEAREQNRTRVVGLSRFLIRRELRVANLASQCYSLAARQMPLDWKERYGVKPVLLETFVDREHHTGVSLSAANWRRLGQSKGRGRDDRQRKHSKSIKDVWVYELQPQARRYLQGSSAEVLAPRSVFSPSRSADWVEDELSGVDLGDQRLNQRYREVLKQRWERPAASYYRSFDNTHAAKGAYRLLESPRPEITLESLLRPHQEQTARRMAAEKVVVVAQDTTALSYNTLQKTQGLGPLSAPRSRGQFLHSLLAFRADGIPLGNLWALVWARPEQSDTAHRNNQSVDQKESGRWIQGFQVACRWAQRMPQTQVVVCGDREADIYELYDQKPAAPRNVQVLVRAQHDRRLSGGTSLRATLEQVALGGHLSVAVPRRQNRPARTAVLELRWKEVELCPPAVALKKSWPTIRIFALWACEQNPPPEVEPIDWMLLSSWPIKNLKMAQRLMKWYGLRWGIECWHRVLKEGCQVERRQMKSALALERALALDIVIASRVMLLTRLGKTHPELPAEVFYTAEELAVLEIKKREWKVYGQPPTDLAPSQYPGGDARRVHGSDGRWSPWSQKLG